MVYYQRENNEWANIIAFDRIFLLQVIEVCYYVWIYRKNGLATIFIDLHNSVSLFTLMLIEACRNLSRILRLIFSNREKWLYLRLSSSQELHMCIDHTRIYDYRRPYCSQMDRVYGHVYRQLESYRKNSVAFHLIFLYFILLV